MIREIAAELQTALRAQGCPLPVVFGPEPTGTTTYGRERVVLEHDEQGDTFGPARSTHKNPKHRMTRNVGCKVTIYAQSPAPGAKFFEHVRRAEHALDLVLVQLEAVIIARRNGWTIKSGRFVRPEDLDKSEAPAGAAYELAFSVERAVLSQTWAGAARPEVTIGEGSILSTTQVSTAHGPDDDENPSTIPATAETSCG